MGFGRPPKEFYNRSLTEGVIIPGMVNAHSRSELSGFSGKVTSNIGVLNFNLKIPELLDSVNAQTVRKAALKEIDYAFDRGTYFYNDIATKPDYADFLRSVNRFQGNRFLELNGNDDAEAEEKTLQAMLAMEHDHTLFPTPNSIYLSSPRILQFVRDRARFTSMTINVLEEKEEFDYPFERGSLYEQMRSLGIYKRHTELYNTHLLPYLKAMHMLSFKKLFLVNLNQANRKTIDLLTEEIPHSAWVLCHRHLSYLGYRRRNLELLTQSPLKLLIGTSGAVTAQNLSIIDEIYEIYKLGVLAPEDLFKSATFLAYDYLEIHPARIPYFLFKGASPNLESIYNTKKAVVLKG